MTKLEKDHPSDLEELSSWASRIGVFGGLAIALTIIGLAGLVFWVLSGTASN